MRDLGPNWIRSVAFIRSAETHLGAFLPMNANKALNSNLDSFRAFLLLPVNKRSP